MPNINVTNLSTTSLMLPGLYHTDPVAPGTTATFDVPDTAEYIGLAVIQTLITNGVIRVETSTDDTALRPVPVYTTAALPAASTFPSGTLVWDSTRMKLVASYNDVWRDETVVIAGTAAALGVLTNVPDNAIAFATDTLTLMRYAPAPVSAFVPCSLSNPAGVNAGLPANPHFVGQLAYNTTTQALMVCTAAPAGVGVWQTVFTAPTGTTGAPPTTPAVPVAGNIYFNTTTNRLSLHDGTAWMHLPVAHFDTAANIALVAGAGTYVGEFGWASDTNRLAVCVTDTTPGPAVWFNETTVGMYAGGATHAYTGAVVFDPTGFINTMANHGSFSVYNGAAWVPSEVVVPGYANVAALPVVGDVAEGTLALDLTGGAGARLYAMILVGAVPTWVTDL